MPTDDFRFFLSLKDYTLLLNALHYYKKAEKQGDFSEFDEEQINALRDKLADQLIWGNTDIDQFLTKSKP